MNFMVAKKVTDESQIKFIWIRTDLNSMAFPHLFDAERDAKINKALVPPYQRCYTVDIDGKPIIEKKVDE